MDILETLSAVQLATESKKMGRMVTTMTEWALLAQSYIIQLISCLVNFFKKPMVGSPCWLLHAFSLRV